MIINSFPFLSKKEAFELLERVKKEKFHPTMDLIEAIGHPYYVHKTAGTIPNIQDIHEYNTYCMENFPDTINKLKSFFSDHLNKNVFVHKDIAMPGFHRMECKKGESLITGLHLDDHFIIFKDQFENIGLKDLQGKNIFSFTVLLHEVDNFQTGLQTLSKNKRALSTKEISKLDMIMSPDSPAYKNFLEVSLYNPYEINIHKCEVMHQVYTLNQTDETVYRYTIQGHLIECEDGWLMYW